MSCWKIHKEFNKCQGGMATKINKYFPVKVLMRKVLKYFNKFHYFLQMLSINKTDNSDKAGCENLVKENRNRKLLQQQQGMINIANDIRSKTYTCV